jgi:hypothetical protein
MFNARAAADHVPALKRIYADHWLVRGLGEFETILAAPAEMCGRLEEQGRRFDRHLGRLKRLRNSVIHGGPVSDSAASRSRRSPTTWAISASTSYESDSHRPAHSLTHDRISDRSYRPVRGGPNHRRYRCAVRRMDIAGADPDLAATWPAVKPINAPERSCPMVVSVQLLPATMTPAPPPSVTKPSAMAVGLKQPADATNATTAPTIFGCTAFPVSSPY